jgi:hypothetical protein
VQKADAIGVTAQLAERDTKQLQDVTVVRRSSQQILVGRHSLAQAAGTVVADSVLQGDAIGWLTWGHGIFSGVGGICAPGAA